MYFDFNEINILLQNVTDPDLPGFIDKLEVLKENTKEKVLSSSIQTLTNKLLTFSQNDFYLLYEDLKKGSIITTEGYSYELLSS